jgi:hypothetical protein
MNPERTQSIGCRLGDHLAVIQTDLRKVDWMSPENMLEAGFARSRVLMINEAHNGLLRCIRTREIGRRLLPVAHRLGVRHLAMEALGPPNLEWSLMRGGYLVQPEMEALLDRALELGIELHGYEADQARAPAKLVDDTMSLQYTNWREREQARNLVQLLNELGGSARLLVWCGNSHHSRRAVGGTDQRGTLFGRWLPMGWHFRRLSHFDHFAIDQCVTVAFGHNDAFRERLREWSGPYLESLGGTAGFLQDRRARVQTGVDAVILSLENRLE